MERHEERPEDLAQDDGHQGPEQAQSQADPDEPNGERRQLRVGEKPKGELVADLSVPFRLGDVVDMVVLDDAGGGLPLRSSGHLLHPLSAADIDGIG